MKKKIALLILAIVVLTTLIFAVPVAASHWWPWPPWPPPWPTPTPTATPAPTTVPVNSIGQFVNDGWYHDGSFELRVGSNMAHYGDLNKPLPSISQIGSLGGHTLKVVIPEGTIVDNGELDQFQFSVLMLHDKLKFGPTNFINVTFSNPVTVYELIDGEWVEIANFTLLKNGQPQ